SVAAPGLHSFIIGKRATGNLPRRASLIGAQRTHDLQRGPRRWVNTRGPRGGSGDRIPLIDPAANRIATLDFDRAFSYAVLSGLYPRQQHVFYRYIVPSGLATIPFSCRLRTIASPIR